MGDDGVIPIADESGTIWAIGDRYGAKPFIRAGDRIGDVFGFVGGADGFKFGLDQFSVEGVDCKHASWQCIG